MAEQTKFQGLILSHSNSRCHNYWYTVFYLQYSKVWRNTSNQWRNLVQNWLREVNVVGLNHPKLLFPSLMSALGKNASFQQVHSLRVYSLTDKRFCKFQCLTCWLGELEKRHDFHFYCSALTNPAKLLLPSQPNRDLALRISTMGNNGSAASQEVNNM